MKRSFSLMPRSLLGQMLLGVALALLVAQAISGFLLWRAAERQRELIALNRVAFQLSTGAAMMNAHEAGLLPEPRAPGAAGAGSAQQSSGPHRHSRAGEEAYGPPLPRRPIFVFPSLPAALHAGADGDDSAELGDILRRMGFAADQVVVVNYNRANAPHLRRLAGGSLLAPLAPSPQRPPPQSHGAPRRADDRVLIAAIRETPSGPWLVTRTAIRQRDEQIIGGVLLQTLVIYIVLVGLLALLLRRVTRPLSTLTQRIRAFGRLPEVTSQLTPRGPDDVRELITATNDMERRIATLIDEKDVMLGAIGHDLKTPLAALRVRVESVDDPAQREKMAATIAEMRQSLDDILTLARIGKSDEGAERVNLAALTESVVEEFEDMGEPVIMGDVARVTARIYPTWLKRALRNLISNALRYGGNATVSLLQEGDELVLRVTDNGPGMAEGDLERMAEPFMRGETSRNRATGGAGLGLAIARAVAEQHGGALRLQNRAEGGLQADIRFPLRA